MRPVRFVALSEDGQALVLADEVGRLLALPIDDRVASATHPDRGSGAHTMTITASPFDAATVLSPRDIQSRIRSGESAEDVARIAGVPVDRVLRYAGPVLQERAMLAQHARRTRLKSSDKGATLADVVDGRLAQHGIDTEKISWDAYRRDDGTWRIVATWPSGKATAQAIWELDRNRQSVSPYDDMAQYLCAERPTQILGQDPTAGQTNAPSRSGHGLPAATDTTRRPGRDPIRAGRDALVAAMDRPLGSGPGRGLDVPSDAPRQRPASAVLAGGRDSSAFDEDADAPKEVPAVPSLAVLRPRRQPVDNNTATGPGDKPRKRLPSWDDVLFGGAPAAREN
ncbi:septation protein SepH [Catellatospora vulcania]|uniref:septation protein SepH n=1 Tax=Catellatospora vulcania TaxID=1460450 RepID=UPI0012D46E63|nr:septation protein SepH [Catellatospora vulcania]